MESLLNDQTCVAKKQFSMVSELCSQQLNQEVIDRRILEELIQQYVSTLSEKELQAYHIAKKLLGMSFQMEKSNGYLQWKKNNNIP